MGVSMSDFQILMLAGFIFVGLPLLILGWALVVSWLEGSTNHQLPIDHR